MHEIHSSLNSNGIYLQCPCQQQGSERCPCGTNVQSSPFRESDLCCECTGLPECRRTGPGHSSAVYCTLFLECSTPISPTKTIINIIIETVTNKLRSESHKIYIITRMSTSQNPQNHRDNAIRNNL